MNNIILKKIAFKKQQTRSRKELNKTIRSIIKMRELYFMLLPGIIYYVIFKYFPMWGLAVAFKDYTPFSGFFKSPWVGIKHFERFFTEPGFFMLLRNNLYIAINNLVFFFPIPILMALILNEVKNIYFKRLVQTLTYMPYFMSWVVIGGISYTLLTTEGGIINSLIIWLGGEKINFLVNREWFRPLILLQSIWKEAGWGTIIFLAAISSVEQSLYEASKIDGAGRCRQMWHITLPEIRSTILILFILRLGYFLDTGFEQIYIMLNAVNREVGEVFDTYVYNAGILGGQYSYSTAVGLFKSVAGIILLTASNWFVKKIWDEGVY